MNTNTFGNTDKSKDRVSGLGVTALGKVVVHVLDIHIDLDGEPFERIIVGRLVLLFFSRGSSRNGSYRCGCIQLQEDVTQSQDILLLLGDRLVEVADHLVAEFVRQT